LEYAQRLVHQSRNVIGLEACSTGMALFRRALAGGARALGVANAGLAVGHVADWVSLARDEPAMLCRSGDAWMDAWLFASPNNAVDCVWVGGRKQVEHGRHRQRDRVRRVYRQAIQALCT